MPSNKHKIRIRKIIQFGNIWLVCGLIYSIVEKGLLGDSNHYPATGNPYNFNKSIIINCVATCVMGMMQGTIEFYFLRNVFLGFSFRQKLIWKTLIYISVIIIFILFLNSIYNSSILKIPLFSYDILHGNLLFIESFSFWGIILFVGSIITLCMLFSEISDYIGHNILVNFFKGRYHRPQTEERIFMFLDMRSSTSIAEKLGHIKFYKLLNQYYADMTNPILESGGQIYQYAGDGILISWPLKHPSKNNRCIECFFNIKASLKKRSDLYHKDFGLMPEFKAAIHCGSVATGQIGIIKKRNYIHG